MRGEEPIDVFFTENKKTDAYTDTRRVSQAVSLTRVVSTAVTVELGVSPPVDGGVSCDERDCMRQWSHILQRVNKF